MSGSPSRVLVAFSGGKDSLATLDICAKAFSRVDAFFMYVVKDLECEERLLAGASKYPNVKLHRIPHPELARLLRGGFLSPYRGQSDGIRDVRMRDSEAYIRSVTGSHWVAYGWRACESVHRRMALKTLGDIDKRGGRFFPLSKWLAGDVIGYLRSNKIPIPPRFGKDGTYTAPSGFSMTPHCLRWLKAEHPADFDKVCRVFPLADAMVRRIDFFPELDPDIVLAKRQAEAKQRREVAKAARKLAKASDVSRDV